MTYKEKHFDANSLQCANFLGTLTRILDSKLKRCLTVEHHQMSLAYCANRSAEFCFDLPREGSKSSIAVKSKLFRTETGWVDCALVLN